ncbi:uncharacterized protein [Primulina eburnea]|uniref:uncharacterized protein n=1 Tax=Primulina eburnea TaxID=1245227 RepID=UPI003C6C5476
MSHLLAMELRMMMLSCILLENLMFYRRQVALTLEGSRNIVAFGTVVCVNGQDKLIHGVPLPHNCIRVSIDEAVDKSTPLAIPIPSECETIGDAVATLVAWPGHWTVKPDEKAERKKIEQSIKKHHLSASVSRSLHMLYCYSKRALDERRYISMILDHDVFDDDYKLILHLEDIIHLYQLEPISANCVVGYIWHLYKKTVERLKKWRNSDLSIHIAFHICQKIHRTKQVKLKG